MASEVDMLVEMGFVRSRAERALVVTDHKGVEPAMEWLLANADVEELPMGDETPVASEAEPGSSGEPSSSRTEEESGDTAKSLKCDDCGKLFKSQMEVEYHAAKTNHSNFSESTEEKKPLTEEEKKDQLLKLEEKMKQKRKEREEKDKVEQQEKERLRIKSGRDMQDAKSKSQEQEMKKIVEQRRRDKIADQKAKDKVLQQITADREARRLANQGILPGSEPVAPAPAPVVDVQVPSANRPAPTEACLQIRLPDGRAITHSFGAKEQLSAVRLFLSMNEMKDITFNLMTTFPKRVFTDEDYDKPLDILGLVPRAVVVVAVNRPVTACQPNNTRIYS